MRLLNENAAAAFRVLDKCSDELEPDGPWRWRCAVQNGTRLPITASFGEGFLHLSCSPGGFPNDAFTLEQTLFGNSALTGGVKLALNASSGTLNLTTDILVLDEKSLFDRFRWVLGGFHDGNRLLQCPASCLNRTAPQPVEGDSLGELLRETSWPLTERGPNDFSAELDASSAPPARIWKSENGILLNVEFIRANQSSEVTRRALTVYLLTASSALRLVRAYAEDVENGFAFGMQVNLPMVPATEEIDHALAALSIAHRACALETNVLLNEATARCYLAARDLTTTNDQQTQ